MISLENFDLDVSISPSKNRAAVGGSLENFILDRNFQSRSKSRIFLVLGPSGGTSVRQEKKSTKISFLGPETARWGGGLPLEKGVVAENFVPALESLSSLGFEERNLGRPGNFAGMSRTLGVFEKFVQKKLRAHFSFPNLKMGFCFAVRT